MKRFFTFLMVVFAAFSFIKAGDFVVTTVDDEGDGSFRAAVSAAKSSGDNNNTIRFDIPFNDEITLYAQIPTFDGAGKVYVVDGLNEATGNPIVLYFAPTDGNRIFRVATGAGNEGVDVTIKNFVVQDVAVTGRGSVIDSGNSAYTTPSFTVTLENCYFKNCSTTAEGGVYWVSHGTDLTIKNCTFEGNKQLGSEDPNVSNFGGGAICSTGNNTAKVTIINSTFFGNYGAGRAGAIYCGHPMTIINTTIVGNQGSGCGGIYFHNANTHTIVNSIIAYNYGTAATTETYANQIDLRRNGATVANVSYSLIGENNLAESDKGDGYKVLLGSSIVFKDYQMVDGHYIPVLADNGGLTPTVALAFSYSSDVLEAGTKTSGDLPIPTTDQRGAPRLDPPSMGAYDNPNYVFSGLPQIVKQALTAWGDGKVWYGCPR